MVDSLVTFVLDDRRYALHMDAVVKVIRIVEISPLPRAPEIVVGVINIHGDVVPIIDARQRFGLPKREILLSDQLIIAYAGQRKVGLIVDEVEGVIEYAEQDIVAAKSILPDSEYVEGVLKLSDGLLLIHDLDQFLSLEEASSLEHALP